MRLLRALVPLCLAASATGVRATPAADAVRVTLGGQTRVYRTVGHPSDADFYCPLTKALRALWLDVRPTDLGDVEVRYQGDRVARWPVVSSPDRLPEDGRHPTVLRQGDELLVPVRAVVALGGGWVDWDDHSRTLTLTPTVRRLELRPGDQGLELLVEASAPVRVSSIQLANPSRMVIDVTPARFHLEHAPEAGGIVRSLRLGQFTKETARAVLELTGGPVRVEGLPHTATTITARLRTIAGAPIARAPAPVAISETPSTAPPSAPPVADQRPGAVPATTPTAPVAIPSTLSSTKLPGPRTTFSHSRGLASRGGPVRRDVDPLTLDPGILLNGKVICIDPGHGGSDVGAQGLDGLREADACLVMATQAARALREAGATVLMTREDDRHVSLEQRYTLANLKGAGLFISIHCNAMAHHGSMSGTETYFWSPQSLDLARAVHPEVVRVMAGRDGAIRQRTFAVIHHTTMPAILIEVGYIDSTADEAKLRDPSFQEAFGNAVREGVVRYFSGQ